MKKITILMNNGDRLSAGIDEANDQPVGSGLDAWVDLFKKEAIVSEKGQCAVFPLSNVQYVLYEGFDDA